MTRFIVSRRGSMTLTRPDAPAAAAVRLKTKAPAVLLAAGWLLLIAAWIGANPPFAGPDEQWHYLRALGVAGGALVGHPAPQSRFGANPRQIAWTRQAARAVRVPAGMAPPSAGCYVFAPTKPATCIARQKPPPTPTVQATPVGTYQPLPYVLPALAAKLTSSPTTALYLGRVLSALLCSALLCSALLYDGAPMSLLGPLLAVTPMVLFSASLLNGSGLEIAAAVCFTASLLRATRKEATPPGAWWVAGASGVLLALSRDASPLWLVLLAGAVLPLARHKPARSRALLATGGALLAAIALNRVWEAAYGPHVELGLANARHAFGEAVLEWWHALTDLVGRFGYLEVHVPLGWTLAWFALVLAALLLALRAGNRRERVVIASTTALFAVVAPIAFWLIQYRHTGFDLQGRQVLPLVVAVPLVAGEVLRRRALGARLFAVAAALTALVQFAAWWTDARRSAVGTGGPQFFLGSAKWSPPAGWGLWFALAVLGAVSVALAGVAEPLRATLARHRTRVP